MSNLFFLDLKHSVNVIAHGIEFLGHRLGLFVLFLKWHISVEIPRGGTCSECWPHCTLCISTADSP